jgi:hypothetical protein
MLTYLQLESLVKGVKRMLKEKTEKLMVKKFSVLVKNTRYSEKSLRRMIMKPHLCTS